MTDNRLPALPPDLRFEPLPDTPEAFEFSFFVKTEALGPHIRARWPWDEYYQRQVHAMRLAEKPFFTVFKDDAAIGTVSWVVHPDHARFGEFYLLEKHQRSGLGTRVLTHVLMLADTAKLPVRLEYLKWSPVGSLYQRNGFRPTHETGTHVFAERLFV